VTEKLALQHPENLGLIVSTIPSIFAPAQIKHVFGTDVIIKIPQYLVRNLVFELFSEVN